MKNLVHLSLLIYLFIVSPFVSSAQIDDCEDQTITICYLPDSQYCLGDSPSSFGCGYSLDGRFMSEFLGLKLLNSDNFGVNGLIECPIELKQLNESISIEYLIGQQCDIVFTGNFTFDTITTTVNFDVTSLPNNLLTEVRKWSLLASSNLVITTQKEAALWGYDIRNQNSNPNTAGSLFENFNIFEGPFGLVSTFNQGGSYQGVIVDGPATGFTTLGVDQNNQPTVVIDTETNDLILGDIGIFCGGAAGSISSGPLVQNNNDRLTCNIFALGCLLAGRQFTTEKVTICDALEYTLPSGEVVTENGSYVDTLQTDIGCDSIILTDLNFAVPTVYFLQETQCEGDGFEYIIGTETFNSNRLTGDVTIQNILGCDSLVTVDITLLERPSTEESFQVCVDEEITIEGFTYSSAVRDTIFYQNEDGCDSLYIINISTYPAIPNFTIPVSVVINVNETYDIDIPLEEDYDIFWNPEEMVSCDNCPNTTIFPDTTNSQIEYIVTDTNLCERVFSLDIDYICPVYIPNAISPKSKSFDNIGLKAFSSCDLSQDYVLKVYNHWGVLVFESNDPEDPWMGIYKSEPVNSGLYVYILSSSLFGNDFQETGNVTVMR